MIYHEGRHFDDLVTTGWRSVEQGEVDAYLAVADHNDAFQLSAEWLDRNAGDLASNEDAVRSGVVHAYGFTPEEENAIKGIMDRQRIDKVDLAKYYGELKTQVAQYAADREHDDRLRLAIVDIVVRSCAEPGSIAQDELDRLAFPRNSKFGDDLAAGLTTDCAEFLFRDLAYRLREGKRPDAKDLRNRSLPVVAVPVQPTYPPPPPVQVITKDAVAETINNFRRLAFQACHSPEKLTNSDSSRAVQTPYIPLPMAQRAGGDLSGCPRFLYDAMVNFVPQGYAGEMTADWLRARVRAYNGQSTLPSPIDAGRTAHPQQPDCIWDPACNCRICGKQ